MTRQGTAHRQYWHHELHEISTSLDTQTSNNLSELISF